MEPRPTRAEVSDAANAVGEGVDAIMLAGETAVGAFPVKTVQTLATIIAEAEQAPSGERIDPLVDATGTAHGRALCEAAVLLAPIGRADAIVAVTREGKTARMLAALRPRTPIIAATGQVAGRRRPGAASRGDCRSSPPSATSSGWSASSSTAAWSPPVPWWSSSASART